jgi:environmental stress-induced protein Ves
LYDEFGFRGEDAPDCRLIDGSVRDFNVMTRRDRLTHTITHATLDEAVPQTLTLRAPVLAFAYVFQGEVSGARAGDTIAFDRADKIALEGAGSLCIVSIFEREHDERG